MKSRGFTLIELLAVIVILAIIALIAVPIVLNLINNSKEQSVKISAEHYFDAVEQAIAREYLKDSTINLDGEYEIIEDGKKIKLGEREINIEYDGEGLKEGTIVIGSGKVKQAQDVKINDYYVTLESGKITLTKTESSGDTGNGGEDPGTGETQLVAGLYDENDNLITSWEDLISNGTINVSADGTTINSGTDVNISGKLVIPNGITSIGYQAFAFCSNLIGVIIPDSVTSIGFQAFVVSGLTELTIPSSVISIGDFAFQESPNLTSVKIEEGVSIIGMQAFCMCPSLIEVNIPNSVTSIGESAFSSCTSLSTITVPGTVTSINRNTFSHCSNLRTVILEPGLTSIGSDAFYNCPNLTVTIQSSDVTVESSAFSNVPTVYYAGYVEGTDYSSWGAGQVLPLQ